MGLLSNCKIIRMWINQNIKYHTLSSQVQEWISQNKSKACMIIRQTQAHITNRIFRIHHIILILLKDFLHQIFKIKLLPKGIFMIAVQINNTLLILPCLNDIHKNYNFISKISIFKIQEALWIKVELYSYMKFILANQDNKSLEILWIP